MEYLSGQGVNPFDFDGLKIRELTPGGLSEASIAEIEVAPAGGHKRAKSSKSGKIYFCLDGAVSFWVEGRDMDLSKKDLLLIRKNEWFDYRNDNQETARLLLIHIPPFEIEAEEFAE